jgi:hypothetical protein
MLPPGFLTTVYKVEFLRSPEIEFYYRGSERVGTVSNLGRVEDR